jgi:cyclic beta-1,2-glucan synthetase
LYCAGLESILCFKLRGDHLLIDPCIPVGWKSYQISFKYHSAQFEITVLNPRGTTRGVTQLELDGVVVTASSVQLVNDEGQH